MTTEENMNPDDIKKKKKRRRKNRYEQVAGRREKGRPKRRQKNLLGVYAV